MPGEAGIEHTPGPANPDWDSVRFDYPASLRSDEANGVEIGYIDMSNPPVALRCEFGGREVAVESFTIAARGSYRQAIYVSSETGGDLMFWVTCKDSAGHTGSWHVGPIAKVHPNWNLNLRVAPFDDPTWSYKVMWKPTMSAASNYCEAIDTFESPSMAGGSIHRTVAVMSGVGQEYDGRVLTSGMVTVTFKCVDTWGWAQTDSLTFWVQGKSESPSPPPVTPSPPPATPSPETPGPTRTSTPDPTDTP